MSFHRFQQLPFEMREHILERCEVRDLHSCLQIEELRTVVQSILDRRPVFWNPGAIQTFQEFLEGVEGTRFSTADDVDQFLEEMLSMKGSNQYPFPGGVVIFVPPVDGNRIDIGRFHEAFGDLVNQYAGAINKLVYCVFNYFGSDIFYRKQLANICKLYNLESLVIYHGATYEKTNYTPKIFNIYPESVYLNAPKLKELLIMEEESRNRFKSPLINYLSLIPNFFDSLEYLQFPWVKQDLRWLGCCPEFSNNLNIISIPKLKKLKLTLFRSHSVTFPDFCNAQRTPLLEEISLLVAPTNGSTLLNSIRFFDRQASSLKSVYLNFRVETQVTREHRRQSERYSELIDWNVEYPNLTQVSIDISLFIADFENTWDIFRRKFLQLETLTLLNNLVEDFTVTVPFRSRTYCQRLWRTLPATLREIRVPHLDLILERGQVPTNLE